MYPRVQLESDLHALGNPRGDLRRPLRVRAPRLRLYRQVLAATLQHESVLGNVAGGVPLSFDVDSVKPDDAVRIHGRVAPVPRAGRRREVLVAPVLVVVSDAVKDLELGVVDEQVDFADRGGNGVGPEDVREEGLGRARFLEAAGIVRGRGCDEGHGAADAELAGVDGHDVLHFAVAGGVVEHGAVEGEAAARPDAGGHGVVVVVTGDDGGGGGSGDVVETAVGEDAADTDREGTAEEVVDEAVLTRVVEDNGGGGLGVGRDDVEVPPLTTVRLYGGVDSWL